MQVIDEIIRKEGDYSDHPADRGGPTRFGITQAVARIHGYTGDMRSMPRELAEKIYIRSYIIKPGFDKVMALSMKIGEEMADAGVNMGASWPGPWLQRTLNALNQPMHSFPELKIDGEIGPATLGALKMVLDKRGADGEIVILRALNAFQAVRYLELTERRPANRNFYYGWMRNRVSM